MKRVMSNVNQKKTIIIQFDGGKGGWGSRPMEGINRKRFTLNWSNSKFTWKLLILYVYTKKVEAIAKGNDFFHHFAEICEFSLQI